MLRYLDEEPDFEEELRVLAKKIEAGEIGKETTKVRQFRLQLANHDLFPH